MKILLLLVIAAAVVTGFIYFQWGLPEGVKYCNSMIRLDYGSATSGQIRYLRIPELTTVATCGDICNFEQCPNCPPENWTCKEVK